MLVSLASAKSFSSCIGPSLHRTVLFLCRGVEERRGRFDAHTAFLLDVESLSETDLVVPQDLVEESTYLLRIRHMLDPS